MNSTSHETIIGIDLGTTNSEVAVIQNEKITVISVDGSKIIPSVVSLDSQGQILVGQTAVNNELIDPTNTIRWIKKKMGLDELIKLGNACYTPPMISSLILKRLKLAAEEFLQHSVSKAVITVPAFFNEKQRAATQEAATLAGLDVVRLINEPTAAALAYSLRKKEQELCLIYDLGGGTFDVSVVLLSPDWMEVKASHGDTQLGGSDIDKMIAEKARQRFIEEQGIDLFTEPLAWARLLRAAETAKILLSEEASVDLSEEFITTKNGIPLHLKYHLTRTSFEQMIRPLIERTLFSSLKALEMAEVTAQQLDRLILVGGATYTPLITQMLEETLKLVPQAWIDPSTVVARGAAIEAANLSGLAIGPTMIDITPHSLGVSCLDEYDHLYNQILIRRNTPIPCSVSRTFYKASAYQDVVRTEVHQGESKDIEQNQSLGNFVLEGLSESEGTGVCIKFQLDRSALLHVTATDVSTGKTIKRSLKKGTKDTNPKRRSGQSRHSPHSYS